MFGTPANITSVFYYGFLCILFYVRTNVFAFSCGPIYEDFAFQAVYEASGLKEIIFSFRFLLQILTFTFSVQQ
jgi:hypothetical protein